MSKKSKLIDMINSFDDSQVYIMYELLQFEIMDKSCDIMQDINEDAMEDYTIVLDSIDEMLKSE